VYLAGPFRDILDTVGDVLLYLDPRGRLADEKVCEGCQQRLYKALRHFADKGGKRNVVLLAHSQGSAIAADVLGAMKSINGIRLVTMGSPISSLYRRFIGPGWVHVPAVPWLNLFRTGDYIAGGVGIWGGRGARPGQQDWSLGAGRHIGYFADPRVWEAIENYWPDIVQA
jgi:hypothetical protein